MPDQGPSPLETRLRSEITGEVLFNRFDRGRYATDASFYQIMPEAVVVPRTMDEALRAMAFGLSPQATVARSVEVRSTTR